MHPRRPARGRHHPGDPAGRQARAVREEPRAARGPVDAAAVSRYPPCARMRRPGEVPRPGPLPRLPPEGGPDRAQAPLPSLRPGAAPAPRGHLRDLRPRRRARQASQDHQLRSMRPAAPQRRSRLVQPLQARRPGLAVPLRRLASRPAASSPALVAGAHRVHRRPPPSRRRGRDLAPRRPGAVRGHFGRAAADPGQRLAGGRDPGCGRARAGPRSSPARA